MPEIGGTKSAVKSPIIESVKIPRKNISFLNEPWDPAKGTTPHGANNSWEYRLTPDEKYAPLLISHVDDHPGEKYRDLEKGDVVYVKFKDGTLKAYVVDEVRDYEYRSSKRGQEVKSLSNVGQEHHVQPRASAYTESAKDPDSIVFQTCITDGGQRITGQKFVVAKPAPGYSQRPPSGQVEAQRKYAETRKK